MNIRYKRICELNEKIFRDICFDIFRFQVFVSVFFICRGKFIRLEKYNIRWLVALDVIPVLYYYHAKVFFQCFYLEATIHFKNFLLHCITLLLRLFTGVVLELVAVVIFTGVDVLTTEMFSGSDSVFRSSAPRICT